MTQNYALITILAPLPEGRLLPANWVGDVPKGSLFCADILDGDRIQDSFDAAVDTIGPAFRRSIERNGWPKAE